MNCELISDSGVHEKADPVWLYWSRRAAACGRAQLLASGAVDMEHGLEIENVGRRGPLAKAATWPLADGPSVCFEFLQNCEEKIARQIPAKFRYSSFLPTSDTNSGENLGNFG